MAPERPSPNAERGRDGATQVEAVGELSEVADVITDAVVDGAPVNWPELESTAGEGSLPMLRALRDVESVISAHRQVHGAEDGVGRRKKRRGPQLRPGDRWTHLEIVKYLGGGGFADVYAARDITIERKVALKLLHPADDDDATQLEEARLLAKVRHDNVVTVFGADRADGRVGIWMELLEGHTLTDELDRYGSMGAAEASVIGMKICDALAAVHRCNIVHRDVKAQNVMREPGGRIVLTDFGIGHDESRGRGAGPAGTPAYLAPELLEGGEATAQSDIYALGVLLFHLVTGSFPVRARSLAEFCRIHQAGETAHLPDLRSDLPEAFVRVVEQALSKSPSRRFRSAGAFHRALSKAVASTVLTGTWTGTSKRTRRRQFLRGALAAAVVLTLAVGVSWHFLAPAVEEPDRALRVLLDQVDDRSGDLAFRGSLDWALRSAVHESAHFEPVSSDEERRISRQMLRPDDSEPFAADELRQAALRLQAPAILGGGLLPGQEGWELTLWLSPSPDEGASLTARATLAATTSAQLDQAIDTALSELSEKSELWLEPGGPLADPPEPLADATTSSLEALRYLTEGLALYDDGRIDESEASFRRAVQLDPEFPQAFLHLGHAVASKGNPEEALEYVRRAFDLRHRSATDLERLTIEAAYYGVVRQYRQALRTYQQLLTIVEADPAMFRQIAMTHRQLGQFEASVVAARKGRYHAGPQNINHGFLVYALATAGEPGEALEEAAAIRSAGGDTPYLLWSEGLALLVLDRLDEAQAKTELLLLSDSHVYQNLGSWLEARVHIYRGDLTTALEVMYRDRRADAVEGTGFLEIRRRSWTARIQKIRGQSSNALGVLDSLREPFIPAHLTGWRSVAVLRAELGDVTGARRILAQLLDLRRQYPSLTADMATAQVAAEIALAEGDPRAAVANLAASDGLADASFLRSQARAHAALGEFEQAALFDGMLIERRGEILDRAFAGFWVEAHVRRARCLERLGRAAEAAAHRRVARAWWKGRADQVFGAGAPADTLPWS